MLPWTEAARDVHQGRRDRPGRAPDTRGVLTGTARATIAAP
jgi:hypothetical protein